MFPLRGLWNHPPAEGDQFVNVEIDWLNSPPSNAVQFSLSGNSPVALSQIVCLVVDNGRSGADVDFMFPDSGFVLTIPARTQGVYPVFTNALMFYAIAATAALGDTTIFQILNSMPPPIPIAASQAQNRAGIVGLPTVNGTTPIIPPPTTGTLNTLAISVYAATAGAAQFELVDGTGSIKWAEALDFPAAVSTIPLNVSGMSIRFFNGLSLAIVNSSLTGTAVVNLYYATP